MTLQEEVRVLANKLDGLDMAEMLHRIANALDAAEAEIARLKAVEEGNDK